MLFAEGVVYRDCGFHQLPVDLHSSLIDARVGRPDLPFEVCHRIAAEAVVDGLSHFNVAPAVLHEPRPLIMGMMWHVSRSAAVGNRWLAGLAEVADERRALFDLLVLQPERRTYSVQAQGQTVVCGQNHRVFPLLRREVPPQVLAQGGPLKCGVVCDLDCVRVEQAGNDVLVFIVFVVGAGQIKHPNGFVVPCVCDQEDLEVIALDVLEGASLCNVHAAVGFDVYQKPPLT